MPAIIFIVGPTAVGKSKIGLHLAQKLNGEIISLDAMQVYRQVNIACDKPDAGVREKIKHHMLDVVDITESFDVSRYNTQAHAAMDDILKRGKTPIFVGGSGMYMAVMLDGIFEESARDEDLRARLIEQADAMGTAALHARLAQLDPVAAAKIHANDAKRVVRALEVVMLSGQPISRLQQQRQGIWGQYPISIFGLSRPRDEMYALAEARVDQMFANGLVEEIRRLQGLDLSRTAATLIGIPEVMGYLNGDYDLERASYLLKRNTRHYVKRQLTWFRRDKRIDWIDIVENQDDSKVVDSIMKGIK